MHPPAWSTCKADDNSWVKNEQTSDLDRFSVNNGRTFYMTPPPQKEILTGVYPFNPQAIDSSISTENP